MAQSGASLSGVVAVTSLPSKSSPMGRHEYPTSRTFNLVLLLAAQYFLGSFLECMILAVALSFGLSPPYASYDIPLLVLLSILLE